MKFATHRTHLISDVRARQTVRQVLDGIGTVCRLLGWSYSMEPAGEGLVPGASARIVLRREEFHTVWAEMEWVVDVVSSRDLHACQRAPERVREARERAGRPGGYQIVTEKVLPPQLVTNAARCTVALWKPACPRAGNVFLKALPPPGRYVTAGILIRQAGVRGVPREVVWDEILGTIGCGDLVTDLRLPLGDATLLHRPCSRRAVRYLEMPDGSRGPLLRHTLPPWYVCAKWHEI